jgi:exonuclease VII large subunit
MMSHLQRGFDAVTSKQQSMFVKLAAQLNHFASMNLQKLSEELFARQQQLTRLDPGPWLDAGWTQLSAAGKNIKSMKDIELGALIQARLRDGILKLKVDAKEPRRKD